MIASFLAASLALSAMTESGVVGRGLETPSSSVGRGLQTPASPEVIREVRVHGNAYLTDAEVLAVAGVTLGDPISADTIGAVEKRLKETGRFETVQIRKRYRSLTDPTDVALVLIVHEKPGVTSMSSPTAPVFTPWRRIKDRLQFLPILNYGDGYGFTYGARFTTHDLLGAGERVSFPFTWGGTRRAAVELERTFKRGPLTRATSTFGIWQRENPRFEIDDRRVELKARAERDFAGFFRVGADASRATVKFGALDDTMWTFGTNAAFDTRISPAFPRNAVYAGVGWTRLNFRDVAEVNRYTTDLRGYAGIIRQVVLAGRVQYTNADGPLPLYERSLLGGMPTLRGYGAGAFDGDRMLVTSGEVRIPVTSVISGGQFGVTAFVDAGKVVNYGEKFADVKWRRGVGGGIFLIASVVKINLDIARGLDDGKTRLHLSTGFAF